jgi:hypothetical protein
MQTHHARRERGSQRSKTPWWQQGPWQWYEKRLVGRKWVTSKIDPPIFPRDAGWIDFYTVADADGREIAVLWRERC